MGRYSRVETWGQMGGGSGRFRGASDMGPAIHLREPEGADLKHCKNCKTAKIEKKGSNFHVPVA